MMVDIESNSDENDFAWMKLTKEEEGFPTEVTKELARSTDGLPLGTILASILPPKAFLRHARPLKGWMHANGRPLDQDTPLADFMKRNDNQHYDGKLVDEHDVACVPDLRGAFLRGMDRRKEGFVDPQRDRRIGHLQEDQIGKHKHRHGHHTGTIINLSPESIPIVGMGDGPENLSTIDEGGEETRPINIAIYYYVRVK